MSDKSSFDIEGALREMGREIRAASPVPSDELRGRILADAAGIRSAPVPLSPSSRPVERRSGWLGALVSWSGGAAVAMSLSLAIGFGIGAEMSQPESAEDALVALEGEAFVLLDLDNG